MPEILHDIHIGGVSTVTSRKRPRQDSDLNVDRDSNGTGIGSTLNHHDQDETGNNGRPNGSQKRARSESHSDEDLSMETSSTRRTSSSTSLRAGSNSGQLNELRSPRRTPVLSTTALTTDGTRNTSDPPTQTVERELAHSMVFDEHLAALRRSTSPPIIGSMLEEDIGLVTQDSFVDQAENAGEDEDVIQRQTESLQLETGSQADGPITTRRLRFANMPSILGARNPSDAPGERASPARAPSGDPSHIFEREQSPSLSESSSVVAARSRLGLVRNPDLAVQGERMRDQLLRWRSASFSPALFGNNLEGTSNIASPHDSIARPSTGAQDRPGSSFNFLSPPGTLATAHGVSQVPEPPTNLGTASPRHNEFLREMRDMFEPFEPFSFDEQQNDQISASSPPSRTVGMAPHASTRRRPVHTTREQFGEESSLLHQTLVENNVVSQPHDIAGSSGSTRGPGSETRRIATTGGAEENSWHERRISGPTEDETQREIRRLTTLVDELQETIRSRPLTTRPVDWHSNNDIDSSLRNRLSQRLRDAPRRALIDEDYPLLSPPMPHGMSSIGRPTSRSLLDPTLSIGLGSTASSSSRQSWSSASEWDGPRSSSLSQLRRNPDLPLLWNPHDDDDTDTDIFETSPWASGNNRSRAVSSLFNETGRHSTLPRTQQESDGGNSSNVDQPLLTRLLSTRSLHPLTHSRRPQVSPQPELQSPNPREASGPYHPSWRAEEPPLPSNSRHAEEASVHSRSIYPARDLLIDQFGEDIGSNIPESRTRDTLLGLDPPPRPVEPRISSSSHGPFSERFAPRFLRPQVSPPFTSSRNNNHATTVHHLSGTIWEPSGGYSTSVSPSNRYSWLRGSEDDALPQTHRNHRPSSRTFLPSFPLREPSPERTTRHNLPLLRNGGESLSDLIRRRTARAERATAAPSPSQRSPSPEIQSRSANYRLPRPLSLFGETESTSSRRRERYVSPSNDEDIIIPERTFERRLQDLQNGRTFVRPSSVQLEESPPELGPQRRSEPSRHLDFAEEPVIPPRPISMLFSESELQSRATRERQQLRDVIGRRSRQDDDLHTGRLIPSTFERTRSLIHRDPLSDEPTRTLQRRLRESEAEVSRALHALNRWGEFGNMEQMTEREREPDIVPPQMHSNAASLRRRRLSNAFSFASNDASQHPSEGTALLLSRLHRSPSPLSTSAASRQHSMQSRWARAQSRFRELTETHGEHPARASRARSGLDFTSSRASRHRDLEEYFRPRRLGIGSRFGDDFRHGYGRHSLGDYMRDEDFDSSYENLIRLSSVIGEARPRGTPSHLVASLPSGLYKDFRTTDCDTRCPICLDDYKDLDPVLRISDCDHWFHKDCLEQWLKNARTCPLCKATVRGRNRGQAEDHASTHDALGTGGREDDTSDDEASDPRSGRNNRRSDSPGLTLDELSTFADSPWWGTTRSP